MPGTREILFATLGSAGDVNPVIALALEMKRRGHRATIITNELFRNLVRRRGLDFIALGTAREAEEIISDPRLWDPLRAFDCLVERVIIPNLGRLYDILSEYRNTSAVVAASALCLGARVAHDKFGIPFASVHLQPALLRSMHDSGRQGRVPMGPHVPSWLKRVIFGAVDRLVLDRQLAPQLNAFLARIGLRPVRGVMANYIHSPQRIIGLFPEWFAPMQPDWPSQTRLAGFVLEDQSEVAPLTPEADEFLNSGPAPVVFTPGSAAATLHKFFRVSVNACSAARVRGMLVTNFPQQVPSDLPPQVRVFPYVPFSRVFPRCAAVVFHGGIGTVAQAIAAAAPQCIVPQSHDQPDNALRVERLGVGQGIYPEFYTTRRAAKALKHMTTSDLLRQRRVQLAAKMDSAAAVRRACDWIESL